MAKTTLPTMDIAALRTFQDTWGPVLNSIPAVINMAESFADVERALNAKRKELDTVAAQVDAAMDEGNAKHADLQDKIAAVSATLADATSDYTQKQADMNAALKALEASISDEIAKSRVLANAEIIAIQDRVKAEKAKLDQVVAEQNEAVKAGEARLADIEARVANAEKALDKLRAKLG